MENKKIKNESDKINNYIDYEKEEKKRKKKNDQIFYIGSFLILLIGIIIYYLIDKFYVSYTEVIPFLSIKKSFSDKNNYKLIKLHTGLEILLINDPSTKRSAASLAVYAGSINDNTIGMAHFCEHMLFLGNKKHQSPSIFPDNLQKYNGVYNAFTSKDKTVYFFELNNNGFIEQFDLFASLFDKPLFNKIYVDKEINAINSEHDKNRNNDLFITDFIVKNEANSKSPFKKFECGNNSTLINENDKLRQELIYYFENFYTNDNMKLVLLSNYSIENMTKFVEDNFISGYVAKSPKLKIQNKLSYTYYKILKQIKEEPIYNPDEDFTKLIYYKSYDGKNILNFYFILKSLYKTYTKNINPEKYFNYMITYKGDNSLLNILIEKGFINNIKIILEEQTEFYYLYKIKLLLTDKGVDNYQLIIKLFFGYINLIKNEGINKEIYNELSSLSKIAFNFKEENNLYKKVINLALNLFMIENKENILIGENINESYDQKIIFDFIEQISIDNCIIILNINNKRLNNDYNFHDNFNKKILPFYDKDYYVSFIKDDIIDEIKIISKINENEYNALFNINNMNNKDKYFYIKDVFKLRTKNNFITKLNNIVLPCYHNYEKMHHIDDKFCQNGEFIPINILEDLQKKYNINIHNYQSYTPIEMKKSNKNNRLEFWYKIDNSFNIPKENIIIQIKSDMFLGDKINYAMLLLLEKYIEVKIDKYLYEAKDSDNTFKLKSESASILLEINCFYDLDKRIIEIINKIIFTELDLKNDDNHKKVNDIFDIIKNKVINYLKSYKSNLAFRTTINKIKKLLVKDITLVDELTPEDINNITINTFEQFIQKFNSLFLITVLFHGSTDIDKINKIYELINTNLNLNANNININKDFIQQKQLKDNTFINYYYINDYLDETNHVTIVNYQMRLNNKDSSNIDYNNNYDKYNYEKTKIYSSLYKKCIGNLFFTKLRTEKQLGYIVVDNFLSINLDTLYFSIIVQGTKKHPEEIEQEINEIVFESININCNSNFEELKNTLLFDIKSNENNLKERSDFFKNEIINMKYNFDVKEKKIEIINNIMNYDEVIKFIKYNFIEKPRRIGIFNYANTSKVDDVERRIEIAKISNGLNDYYMKNKVIYTDNEKIILNNNNI